MSHPFIIPGFAPEEASAIDQADASGKLKVLDQMLHKIKAADRRALLLLQDPNVRIFTRLSA